MNRCEATDPTLGRCVLDADHPPNWLGVTQHAGENVDGPPGPPQRWVSESTGENQ